MSEETENVEQTVESTEVQQVEEKPSFSEKLDDGTYKVDFTKVNQQEEVTEQVTQEQEQEEVETPILEEIIEEPSQEPVEEQVAEVTQEQVEQIKEEIDNNPDLELPENIQDLVKFMNETNGTLEDYVRLNADYSNVDDMALLREYYKNKKKHLSDDEITFLIDDKFSFDEDVDEDVDIRRKKLAFKEEVGEARDFLNSLKDQYYKEVKLGSKLLPEQQKAIDFFNRYNNEQQKTQELAEKQKNHFINETNKVFNSEFKGFDFNVGDKKFRYNVKDVDSVKQEQRDLLNVFGKYIKDNMLQDAGSYHKALFAANNPDAIANHFYEQGRADAIKKMTAEAKNINMDPRKTNNGEVDVNGTKIKVVSGENSSNYKFKLKNY